MEEAHEVRATIVFDTAAKKVGLPASLATGRQPTQPSFVARSQQQWLRHMTAAAVRLRYWIYQASMSGDPVARTRCRTKSAEITHAAIWPSDLHAPHAALSHDR